MLELCIWTCFLGSNFLLHEVSSFLSFFKKGKILRFFGGLMFLETPIYTRELRDACGFADLASFKTTFI